MVETDGHQSTAEVETDGHLILATGPRLLGRPQFDACPHTSLAVAEIGDLDHYLNRSIIVHEIDYVWIGLRPGLVPVPSHPPI